MQEIAKGAASELRKLIKEAMGSGGINSKIEGRDFWGSSERLRICH